MRNLKKYPYVWIDGVPGGYQIYLKVEWQHFRVGPYWETKTEANWYANQLGQAIEKLRFRKIPQLLASVDRAREKGKA